MANQKKNLWGFTLVELIVVITIVGILSTVGFVSYSGYLTGARDSNRISQLTKITDSLQVYSATKSLPLPDTQINISVNGTLVAYQGDLWEDVLETIDFANGGLDPKDDTYFTYYLTSDRNTFQVMGMMEEIASVSLRNTNDAYAVDYTQRFPKVYGRQLGVLTSNSGTLINTPADKVATTGIDLFTTTGSFIANLSDTSKVTGTGVELRKALTNGSCLRLKESGLSSGNGVYTINPRGTGTIQAYCEMEEEGGGWTLVARSVSGGVGGFTLATTSGSVSTGTTLAYTMNATPAVLLYSNTMFASYTSGFKIDSYKTTTSSSGTLTATGSTGVAHTLTVSSITWGSAGDGFNGKQGMLFVK